MPNRGYASTPTSPPATATRAAHRARNAGSRGARPRPVSVTVVEWSLTPRVVGETATPRRETDHSTFEDGDAAADRGQAGLFLPHREGGRRAGHQLALG